MKIINCLLFSFLLFSGASCKSDLDENGIDESKGIVPESIDQVVDVFELKFGEVKECVYDDQILKFSIVDIEDSVIKLSMLADYLPEALLKSKIHAYINVETDRKILHLKVSSTHPSPLNYYNDGTDVSHVWELLARWQFEPANDNFYALYGDGARIVNTTFSIYMAKAYPLACILDYNIDKSMYNFIFFITTTKK
jgi:hypothetical protein